MIGSRLSREELAAEASRLAKRVLRGKGGRPITSRTIRYWTDKGLLEPRGGPNLAGRYEPEFVLRCVFIRKLQELEAIPLEGIQRVMTTVDLETIRRVVEGEEPLDLAHEIDPEAVDQRRAKGEEVIDLAEARALRPSRNRPRHTDDAPRHMGQLSDADKAKAVQEALQSLGVEGCTAKLLRLDRTTLGKRGRFRAPMSVEFELSFCGEASKQTDQFDSIRAVSDVDLCSAIADCLSKRTGERYAIDLAKKRYPDPNRLHREKTMLLSLLVASDISMEW